MTVEASKKVRAALKAKGYGKAEVSVYNQSYSLGSTVYVTIKQAAIPLAIIEELAKCGERIDRDSATGEILGGANCFVDVRYADGVLDEHAARINEQVAAGRRRFGRVSLEEQDAWTWQTYESTGDGFARAGMRLDRKLPGDGLARILASAGELHVLHDDGDASAAAPAPEPQPCPVCGSAEDHVGLVCLPVPQPAPSRFIGAAPANDDERRQRETLARARAVAAEMAPPPLVVEGAAPHELAALRACLDSFAAHVAADRWSVGQALETMAQAAFALGRSGR